MGYSVKSPKRINVFINKNFVIRVLENPINFCKTPLNSAKHLKTPQNKP